MDNPAPKGDPAGTLPAENKDNAAPLPAPVPAETQESVDEKKKKKAAELAQVEAQYNVIKEIEAKNFQESVKSTRRKLFILGGALALFCTAGLIFLLIKVDEEMHRPKKPQAYMAAQDLARQKLNFPGGVFAQDPTDYKQLPGLEYEVSSWVETTDGKHQRSTFKLRMTFLGERQWRLDNFEITGQ